MATRLQKTDDDTILEITDTVPVKERHSKKRLLKNKDYFEQMIAKGQDGLAKVNELLAIIEEHEK